MAEEKKEVKKDEDWMQKKWRPAMGWMYMAVCVFDMVIFPVLWALIQSIQHQTLVQWNPLSLQGAGLFHIAMGAVLGIAAFGRTQEKIAGTAGNTALPTAVPVATPPAPAPVFSAPQFAPAPMPAAINPVPGDPPTRNTRND